MRSSTFDNRCRGRIRSPRCLPGPGPDPAPLPHPGPGPRTGVIRSIRKSRPNAQRPGSGQLPGQVVAGRASADRHPRGDSSYRLADSKQPAGWGDGSPEWPNGSRSRADRGLTTRPLLKSAEVESADSRDVGATRYQFGDNPTTMLILELPGSHRCAEWIRNPHRSESGSERHCGTA